MRGAARNHCRWSASFTRPVYREGLAECQAQQDLYDRETRHGNHRSAQGRWTQELAAELAGAASASAVAAAD